MNRKTLISLVSALAGFTLAAQSPNPAAMAEKMDRDTFRDCIFAVKAVYDDGTPIVSLNENRMMLPASTLKTVTTAAALEAAGKDYRWTTELAVSGKIGADGILKGNLHIIGGGDPTIAAGDAGAVDVETLFTGWLGILEKAGIKGIDGFITGDGRWIEGMREEQTWMYEDVGTFYGTCVSGLNFHKNSIDFSVKPGTSADTPPSITKTYPAVSWMNWKYECSTGPEGSGDQLFLFGADEGSTATVRGTYALGKAGKTIGFRNNFPELTLCEEFRDWLEKRGIRCNGIRATFAPDSTTSAEIREDGLTVIGRTLSPTLDKVVFETLQKSDNFYAEALFRTIGRELEGGTAITDSRRAVVRVLSERFGMDCSGGIRIVDGSGLSRTNLLSAEMLCRLLNSYRDREWFGTFSNSLTRYGHRTKLKTGSFGGCRNLCGYITPSTKGGRTIIFSIMVNNSMKSITDIDREERKLIDALEAIN